MQNEEKTKKRVVELFNSGEWKKIRDAIHILKPNTGGNLIFDPYKDPFCEVVRGNRTLCFT